MVNTEKGKTYRAGSPDLTQFDPIRNTVGNRPQVGTVRATNGGTSNLKKGDTVRAANSGAPKRKDEPALPRREYPQG